MRFGERLAEARSRSPLVIGLAPVLSRLPYPIQRYDEPLLPFGKAVIDATADLVCGYVFHLSAYLALGAAGAVAMERTIAYAPGSVLKILHGPFASPDYAPAAFENAFIVDAVTLIAYGSDARHQLIRAYVELPQHGVFIESPPGFDLQPILKDYPGQIGIYRQTAPDQGMIGLSPAPFPDMAWHWGSSIYTSQGDDFRDALRLAATRLRQPDKASS